MPISSSARLSPCRFATTMAASDYKYVILGGGQAAGYTAQEVGAGTLPAASS